VRIVNLHPPWKLKLLGMIGVGHFFCHVHRANLVHVGQLACISRCPVHILGAEAP